MPALFCEVFPCLDLLAVDACLYLFAKTLLLAFVLELVAVQPSKICHFQSSSDNIAVSVRHWAFHSARDDRATWFVNCMLFLVRHFLGILSVHYS